MTLATKRTFLCHIAMSMLACGGVCLSNEVEENRLYPFVFKESTADTQFVLADSQLLPVRSFSADSNAKAVAALTALKANILYPNADGTKIFLTGSHDGKSVFTLKGWFIVSPFLSSELVDEAVLPHRFRLVKRLHLIATDFSIGGVDPGGFVRSLSQIDPK